jgi:hypothetical protein
VGSSWVQAGLELRPFAPDKTQTSPCGTYPPVILDARPPNMISRFVDVSNTTLSSFRCDGNVPDGASFNQNWPPVLKGAFSKLQLAVSVAPDGKPSSEIEPFREALFGRVMVWFAPALTTGGWFGGVVTVNPLVRVTISVPVMTVTFVGPSEAAAVIETGTVRLVAVAVPEAPAVTAPLANVTTEDVLKCVKLPVIITGMFIVARCPVFGFTKVITGVPAPTVNPFASVTTSAPVVTVTLVAPSVAATVIDTGTVRLVTVAAVGAPAATAPLAKVTTEELLKWVKFPVMVTGTLFEPC